MSSSPLQPSGAAWRSGLDLVWKGQHREGRTGGRGGWRGLRALLIRYMRWALTGTSSQKSARKTSGGRRFLPDTDLTGCGHLIPPPLLPTAHPGASTFSCPSGLSAAFAGLDHPFDHPFLLMLFPAGTPPRPGGHFPQDNQRCHTAHTCPSSRESLLGTSEAQPCLVCWAGSRGRPPRGQAEEARPGGRPRPARAPLGRCLRRRNPPATRNPQA